MLSLDLARQKKNAKPSFWAFVNGGWSDLAKKHQGEEVDVKIKSKGKKEKNLLSLLFSCALEGKGGGRVLKVLSVVGLRT